MISHTNIQLAYRVHCLRSISDVGYTLNIFTVLRNLMSRALKLPKKSTILIILFGLFLVGLAFIYWLLIPYPAETEYLDQVYNNSQLEVKEFDGWYQLLPVEAEDDKAIIFYPGGLVSPDAYLYMLSEIATELNRPIFVAKFPLNLAVTDINAADRIIDSYSSIENWTISGHSLGGSMACRYALANPETIDNLVMMASYCDQSISDTNIQVLTLYGSKNNGITENSLEEFEQNLPADATSILIEGMNHAQFGNYGAQRGDNEATIDDDKATEIVVEEITRFLSEIDPETE